MVGKEEIKQQLIRACYWYYVKAEPIISDYDYDILFKELERIEEFDGAESDSPTQMIYGDREQQYPNWAKTKF